MTPRLRRIAFLAVLFGAGLGTGCVEVRDRPLPFDPDSPPSLSVEVLSPGATQQQVVAGRDVQVRVRAREPDGRLVGVGFFIHRSFDQTSVLLEDQAFFGSRTDTLLTFDVTIPEELPTNTQISIVGVAHGTDESRELSEPMVVMVIRCSENSIFCS